MYTMVFDNLRPWMARGITKKDLDACTPVAAADMNTTYGTPGQQFRLLMWNNEAIITSGGLRRNAGQEGLEYYQISQIQDAAWRFGLPNMEFAVGFGDMSSIAGERDGGLCPLMIYCKKPDHYDILIPDGQFTQYMYDTWLEKNRMDNYGEPWDKKVDKAVGRYTGYCSAEAMTGRFGVSEKCIRLAYSNHSRDTKHEFTDLKLVEPMPLAEHRKWKYTVHLDGIGCSNRLQKLMATGLTILKQDSTLTEFFYGGLRPWVHYVPTGYNGVDEVSRMVQFLRKNDDMAKAIGEQARKFAHEHLSEEGRLCYIKVLFEETKKLMQYEPKLVDFPNTITFDDEMKDHLVEVNATQVDAFADLVADHLAALHRARELQVRNAQLDKEAAELRAENETLLRSAEEAKHSAVASAQYAALEARTQELQSELTAAYKEKASLAEASLQATRQLQVVRDINERQSKELSDAAEEAKRLRDQLRELRRQADHYREAHATVSKEMEARLAEAQAASARADSLEAESAELVRRIIGMKDREADRLNEMNRQEAETVARAKQEAASILAEARAKALSMARRSVASDGAEAMVEGAMRSLRLEGEDELPTAVVKSIAGAHAGGCYGLAFSRTGAQLASGGADKTVKIWEPSTATPLATLHGSFEGINAVAFTSDARLVLAAENKLAVRAWDVSSGRLRLSLTGHQNKVTGVACSPADANVVATCAADRTIKLWGLEKGFAVRTLMHHSTCNTLALSSDGALIASGHFDGALRFWDVRSGRQAHEVAGLHSQQITSVCLGASGSMVLTCGKDNLLRCVDVRRFEVRHTLSAPAFTVGGAWTSACLSPSEQQAAAGSADGTIFLWDVPKGSVAARLREPKQAHSAVACAWCPLGLPLVSSDKAGGLTFWGGGGGGGGGGVTRRGRQHSL
ncbi:autophagy-related 16 [Micractinium conductrix]|uniref:Autophagy-related 16 n=1 Tax=Micractinium conductrix TaxID=554055 RepID=A0A2P6VHV3_9CHLO|nr:autophagy-related 16 [Micractinium conductrix]|eukprot:PSC73673.1 autophagy-related 16 [Micractinium conductrix]